MSGREAGSAFQLGRARRRRRPARAPASPPPGRRLQATRWPRRARRPRIAGAAATARPPREHRRASPAAAAPGRRPRGSGRPRRRGESAHPPVRPHWLPRAVRHESRRTQRAARDRRQANAGPVSTASTAAHPLLPTATRDHTHTALPGDPRDLAHQPGLADARLAGEEHKRAAAGSGVLKRRYQIRQLLDAPDERARGSLGRRSGRHLLHRPSSIAASVDRTIPPV